MEVRPKLSIVIPIHDMQGGAEFLWRSINALTEQTFQDFEIIITKQGKMAENSNAGIKKARGEYIKILYLDDCLSHPKALEEMIKSDGNWLICGTNNNPNPYWTDDIETGNNRLGSPSALMMKNDDPLLFDENLSWLLDCDLYKRMYKRYGAPDLLWGDHVTIGEHPGQMTHLLSTEVKLAEHEYLMKKHE